MAPSRRSRLLLPAAALVLAGCSAVPPPSPPVRSDSAPSSSALPSAASEPTAATATPTAGPTPEPPSAEVPLALVVHATRPLADVPTAKARRLVAEGARRWSAIDQPGGRLTVVRGEARTSAAALRRVRSDRSVLAVVPADTVDARVRVLTVGGRHPLRDPRRYPLTSPAKRPVGEVTTLTLVGDMMLARRVGESIAGDPAAVFRPLAKRLARAEITAGNLESTLSTDGSPTQGGDSFGARPEVLRGLDRAGFDLVSLANNHVGDYGDRAMRQTFSRLRAADLAYVGAGRDRNEARRPVIVDRDGVRVGFLATESIGETPAASARRAGTNRLNMPPRTGPLDRAALRRIRADIAALDKRVDVVVVIPHWGTQYTHRVEASQRTAARAFAAAGADLVLGGHPHWVQGFENIGRPGADATVVYSLGNFIFDMDFAVKTREGIFLEIVLWDGRVKAVEPVPYVIDGDFTPRLARGDRARGILADVWSSSRGPFRRP